MHSNFYFTWYFRSVHHFRFSLLFYAEFQPYVLIVYSHSVYYSFQFLNFFPNSLMSSMYIRWLIFSCDLLSLYPAVHVLSMWLSSIIAIINSNSDNTSSRKILFLIFASAKFFSPAINSTIQVYGFIWYLVYFRQFYIHLFRTTLVAILPSVHTITRFFRFILLSFRMC